MAGGLNLAFGKQHGGKQVAKHRLAGRADQTLFAQLAGLVAPARVEGGGRAADDVFGGFFHAPTLEQRSGAATAVIVRESGRSSTHRLPGLIVDSGDYWMPRFRGA
jgi:hypothetical protein